MKSLHIHYLVLAAYTWLSVPALSEGQLPAPVGASVSPAARLQIDQMVSTYSLLSSYSSSITITTGGHRSQYGALIQRPNRAAAFLVGDGTEGKAVADGTYLSVLDNTRTPHYTKTLTVPGARAIESTFDAVGLHGTVPLLLTQSRSPFSGLGQLIGLEIQNPSENPHTTDTILIQATLQGKDGNVTVLYEIGRSDHLLRRVTETDTVNGKPIVTTEEYTDIHANPILPDSAFTLAAPAPKLITSGAEIAAAPMTTAAPILNGTNRFDFGSVSPIGASALEHVFVLRNDDKSPIKITSLRASCGCTSALIEGASQTPAGALPSTMAPVSVNPGQTVRIRVSMNLASEHFPGPFIKTVSVSAKSTTAPITTLMISGNMLAPVSFSPPIVDFGDVNANGNYSQILSATIDANLTAPNSVPLLKTSNPYIVLTSIKQPTKSADGKTIICSYKATISPNAPLGHLQSDTWYSTAGDPSSSLGQARAILKANVIPR